MPKVTKKGGVYVLEPTFGEQLAEALPQMLMQMRQIQEQNEERRLRRLQLQMKYAEATPEVQEILGQNPDFVQEATGRRPPVGSAKLPPGYVGPTRPGMPIRDLTEEEVKARRAAELNIKQSEQGIQRTDQLMQQTRMQIEESQKKLAAFGKIEGMPPESLTMMDFVVAFPEMSHAERADLFVGKKFPGYEEKIAQQRAGAGPEVERAKEREAFKECTETFGSADKNCLQYAVAMGKGDVDALSGLPNLGMKTLAFKRYEQDVKESGLAVQRANRTHADAIGSAALRIIDDDPRIPLEAAHGIASAIMDGRAIPPALMQFEVDRVTLKREVTAAATAKLRLEESEATSGVKSLRDMIQTHMSVLAQKELGVEGLDLKSASSKQLSILMPELTRRVATLNGLPSEPVEGKGGKVDHYGPDWLYNFVWASAGFVKSASDPFGWERRVASRVASEVPGAIRRGAEALPPEAEFDPRAAVQMLRKAGHVVSSGLEIAFGAANRVRKAYVSTVESMEGKPAVKAPPPGEVKPPSDDQRIHMENISDEIRKHMLDRTVPLSVKENEAKVLDLIEEIMKGARPFTDLINASDNR